MKRDFASDNNAGIHPEVLAAIAAANAGHAAAYGADEYTTRAEQRFREVFGERSRTFFVSGGTSANVLALRQVTRSHEAIVCAATAHINVDECGALEATAGRKLLLIPSADGKLTPPMIGRWSSDRGDLHRVQPRVLSITQATEYGTVYTPEELRRLCDAAHELGMLVHMDGARVANAAAALQTSLGAITGEAGVDILTFGGTKNGLMGAEAIVFFDDALADGFLFLRKQMMQLSSKMRFLAVQLETILTDELWRRSAERANEMAALLSTRLRELPGLLITQPVQTNAVFACIPQHAIESLRRSYRFSLWNAATLEVRWMTAFDTTEEDVDQFVSAVREALEP